MLNAVFCVRIDLRNTNTSINIQTNSALKNAFHDQFWYYTIYFQLSSQVHLRILVLGPLDSVATQLHSYQM